MLIRRSIVLVLFFTTFYFKNYSQSELYRRFQIGLSTNVNFPIGSYFGKTYVFPGLPLPLTVNVKVKRHEFVFGPDFYTFFVPAKRSIIGLDGSYRYHFYKPGKKRNFYLDVSAYFVEFAHGTTLPVNYNFSKMDPNESCISSYKVQTPAASTGIGIELPFLKYFTFFSHVGFGFIYVHTELDKTCTFFQNQEAGPDNFYPTVNVVCGFAGYFYTKKLVDTNHGLQTVEKQP